MAEEKPSMNQAASDGTDAAGLPFDFVGEGGATALVCEPDSELRRNLEQSLTQRGYRITMPATAKDALKALRFHLFDVVVLNELFDAADPQTNAVLRYLETMIMTARRRLFVVLVSDACRTMDPMAAFNRSVNMVINRRSIDRAGDIIGQAMADHKAFYHVFQETLYKMGKA